MCAKKAKIFNTEKTEQREIKKLMNPTVKAYTSLSGKLKT